MHSDQTRKDGSSESMIQALYYDFVFVDYTSLPIIIAFVILTVIIHVYIYIANYFSISLVL